MRLFWFGFVMIVLVACGAPRADQDRAQNEPASIAHDSDTVIYIAASVITMAGPGDNAPAVAVRGGEILGTGEAQALLRAYPKARVDRTFADKFILPGLIDPHVHVMLGSMQYSLPVIPPWEMAMPDGMRAGIEGRAAFLAEVAAIEASSPPDAPVFIYGYHNLVHGDLTKADLDAITTKRPLIIWHYSSHDFYLNSAALDWAGVDASWADRFHGVDLAEDGSLTGRIYEDAALPLFQTLGRVLLAPEHVNAGWSGFSHMLRRGGVTTIAEMGYGIFGWELENHYIAANWSMNKSGYRLYLVPEHRALERIYGEERVEVARKLAAGEIEAPAPVLPQVKFFTDAAFYSQTMRLSAPGYLAGQSKDSEGLWVIPPDRLSETIMPYWQAGLDAHIHSNGDAAQAATLKALAELRASAIQNRFIIEHGGLFSPDQVAEAGRLGAIVSIASHYVFYMAETYRQALGPRRAAWISPLGSLSAAGVPITLHSDAPLAPPQPLLAASRAITRQTREGGTYEIENALTPYDAMEAITLDAARALRLDDEIGSIAAGKRADFTILDANPLETPADAWADIGVWGVVLDGEKHPLEPFRF